MQQEKTNADKCETVKELNKTVETQNETVQEKIDSISKIELPAYKTPNLVLAINQVMREVKNVEKNSTVGSGDYAFNAVSDKDVKFQVGQAMERAGLVVIPISVEPTATIDRYEDQWKKRKKDVFTEVKTKYLLMHESGEKIEFAGYGQAVDNMDKSAGKATTYALKYALLYLFMVPTGKIDDADKTQPPKEGRQAPKKAKQTLNDGQFVKALKAIEKGDYTKDELKTDYILTEDQEKKLPK
tara:strand:+ start:4062 stop:4787 length:726 start_codon:yes stop_codon:yes gene_type:complete